MSGRIAYDCHGRQRVELAAGDTHAVIGSRGTVLRCLAGLAWVTQEGDPLDRVLPHGARYCSAGRGLIVVSAIDDGTRIAVCRVAPHPAQDWIYNRVEIGAGTVEAVQRAAREEAARRFAALVTLAWRGLRRAWRRLAARCRGLMSAHRARGYHG